MPAPAENQNAVKDEAEVASSFLHVRAVPRDKAGWVKAAKRRKQKLAEWVTATLNTASASSGAPTTELSEPAHRTGRLQLKRESRVR